jgi:threonine dehydratase
LTVGQSRRDGRVENVAMVLHPVGPDLVEQAAARIEGRVRVTPVVRIEAGGLGPTPVPVILKLELLQHTGSFKPRGIFNRLLSVEVGNKGVVAASGGNAGLAVAYAARELGYHATIFVPETAPAIKVTRLRGYGAEVRQVGATYAEALAAAQEHALRSGAVTVHAYDQPEVVAGQGTLGRELEAQLKVLGLAPVDTVLVAVGGGGLIGGIAGWFAGRARVVAVEPLACPTYASALASREPVDVEVSGRAADSLGAQRIGEWCWAARDWIADSVLVADDVISEAQRRLWESCRVIAEPGGATAVAALIAGAYVPQPEERVAVIVCGANTDPADVLPPPH